MALRKGISIVNLRAFLHEHVGPDAWERLVMALPEEDRHVLSSLLADGWYELALHARVNRALCDLFFDGNLAAAEALGRFAAERDLGINHRFMLRLLRPSFALRHLDIFWRDDEESGHWKTTIEGDHIKAELSGWQSAEPALCRRLLGYMSRLLEVSGTVSKHEHIHCRAHGHDSCVFEFTWQAETDLSRVLRKLTKAEIPEVGHELCQLPDLDSLADAIVDLIQLQLAFSRVELRIAWPDTSELALLRSVGTSTANAPVHFVLQTADRNVGRIDVEGPPQAEAEEQYEFLRELLPWIALTLDAARLASPRPTPLSRFTSRLLVARTKWKLTPKQAEVLELVLRGDRNKEIGEALGCEESTVEQHVTRIKRAAEAKSRVILAWKFWMEL